MGKLIIDNQYLPQAQALISEAQQEISIATFKLEINEKPKGRNLKQFFEQLVQKSRSGIRVRILFNWHDDRRSVAKTNYSASITLKNAGCDVRYLKNNRCCHAKMLLVDRKKAIIGSHNLSVRSCANNFEISYIIPDPESVAYLTKVFESSFWDAKKI